MVPLLVAVAGLTDRARGQPEGEDPAKSGAERIEGTANPEPLPVTDPNEVLRSTIRFPGDMVGTVFAREPDVQDPTAISFDGQNRLYVAETHRFDRGVEDNRRNGHWLRDEIALTSTAERLAMYEKHAEVTPMAYFTQYSEKIRRLEDRDGDGKADHAQIFADGFDHPLDGTAAGVMAAFGRVYFACIPHVWMLEDTTGDGVADKRESLQEGFGVSVSLSGHDLNGFALGPDGRIYFTIGDRGYNLKTREGRHLDDPYAGAIFRMEPDGRDLEVVHRGLRNPKEIAFDRFGNAFSVDNNADMGDLARIVPMVEGADSGWNRGHQNLRNFRHVLDVSGRHRIPWMEESIWEEEGEYRPNFHLPPAAHLSNGPSGLTYNPGTGLAEKWDNHFLVCDFKGGDSAVIAFQMAADGAGFRLVRDESFLTGLLNTDVEFGYDGKLYVSDYTGSWPTHGLGAIYAFHHPEEIRRDAVAEMKQLFAEGFKGRPGAELEALLGHADMRVRLRAQFALAGDSAHRGRLVRASGAENPLVTRLHGVWGLGQLARQRRDETAGKALAKLCDDADRRVRGEAVRALGEAFPKAYRGALAARLDDDHARNRMLAAIALGKAGDPDDVPRLIELLDRNADADVYLRHGAVQGLRTIAETVGNVDALTAYQDHPSSSVRLALVLALRHLGSPAIAAFLDDADEAVVVETIQAINDGYIGGARPALARSTEWLGEFSPMIDYRILNVIFRVGGDAGVRRLLELAADDSLPSHARVESLFALGRWSAPPPVDPTTGRHRPLETSRDLDALMPEITSALSQLVGEAEGEVLAELISTMEALGLGIPDEPLLGHFGNANNPRNIRLAALEKLLRQKPPGLEDALRENLDDRDAEVRARSLSALAELAPDVALARIRHVFDSGEIGDRQRALEVLGGLDHPAAAGILARGVRTLGEKPLAIRLDILEAAARRDDAEVARALEVYHSQNDDSDPMETYRLTLEGGDVDRGRWIFYNHGAAQCVQCHKGEARRKAGGVAGPDLRNVGGQYDREYLLESLLLPNARIAEGYSPISLTLEDGTVISGMLGRQDEKSLTVIDGEGESRTYLRERIRENSDPLSTMPPMGTLLDKPEMRDLVAYLATLKSPERR
jgi:quinoprotein glucose dehydrogenase